MANMNNFVRQAQALQANMQKAQAEIANLEVTGESGGGMVKVLMSGRHGSGACRSNPRSPPRTAKCSRT
jgi:hypothetical protein